MWREIPYAVYSFTRVRHDEYGTHVNASCHAHISESCRHIHDSFLCVVRHIHRCHMDELNHPISRLLKIIRLFCRISSLLQDSFAKETYSFQEPTNRSHRVLDIHIHALNKQVMYTHTLSLTHTHTSTVCV